MKWNGPYRALSLALHHWPALRAAIVNVPATRKWAFLGAFSEPGRNGLIDGILLALHESRRRQADREIQLYDHLIQYARMYPLIFDGQDKPIGPAAE
jgi:hypothetical protein